MERAIWTGSITFGLVNIPVELYSGEKRFDLHFHMLDSRNKARIHYERVNDDTGKEVPWDQLVKAYEYDKNNYVIVENKDFKQAAPKAVKSIDIEDFVNLEDIDYAYFDKPYYLVPQKNAEKGYVLLREALKKTKKVGIAKIVIRTKQYLAAVKPVKNALMLILLRFDQELRKEKDFHLPDKPSKSYKISDRELEMAKQLINNMESAWKPEKYHDEYRDALLAWIEDKAKHGKKRTVKTKEKEPATSGKVIDFMSLLQKSLANKKVATKTKKPTKTSVAKKASKKAS